ncbi:collagen alpha-2(IV) chain-like [Diprion similis]|uniref:collagen alpha-2(IV) chain-like n=1 Tax=Diprion similis TaxID=362088 RepID=UPI001EF87828|nr:collagen alpha-2(IV) chain-like [Diprion similis]
MYGKLIILLAVAGSLSAQSNTTLSLNTTTPVTTTVASTTDTTSVSTTESTTNSTTGIRTESTTASTTNATSAAQSTTQSATKGTRRPGHHGPHRHPRPPGPSGSSGSHNNPKPSKPHGLHGPPNPVELPGLPILSSFLNAFGKIFEPLVPNVSVSRHPRSTVPYKLSDSFNTTDMSDLLNGSSLPGLSGIPDLRNFQMPNVSNMVPSLPEISNPQDLNIPEIPNFPSLPMIPGMRDVTEEARQRVANEISPGQDLVSGIQSAIQNGLSSSNPTEAMRGLISTILDAYSAVARNCPFLIVGGYIMREGLWLSSIVLSTMADITEQIYNDS